MMSTPPVPSVGWRSITVPGSRSTLPKSVSPVGWPRPERSGRTEPMSRGNHSLSEDVDWLWERGIKRIRRLERNLQAGADPREVLADWQRLQRWFTKLDAL